MESMPREKAKVALADVPGEKVFWNYDGRVFKNMRELRDGLANMSDEAYSFHANKEKNDFCKWVRDVIKDERLAAELQNSTSRAEAARRVGNRIASLSRR